MSTTELIERTGFHDSSITALSMDGDHICLRFEDVWVDDDNCYNAVVDLRGVRKVMRNDEVVHELRMEGDYASVLELSRSGHTATLFVNWQSFTPRKEEPCSYEFDFNAFDLQAEKQN
jgi:hypothetical protein